jgi:uncharacterized protein YukE
MSASSTFADLLEQLDMWWPEGDGEALRSAANGWSETADLIDEITDVLNAVAERLTDNYRGEAADRFAETWARWNAESGYLGITAADCRRLATALMDFANDVDVADRTLVQLIEQALTAAARTPNPINPMMLPQDWMTWLQASGDQLFGLLSTQTSMHTTEIDTNVGNCSLPPAPGDRPDLSSIIKTNITWPDPGKPTDLSELANGEINFGGGQGCVPSIPVYVLRIGGPPTVVPTPGPTSPQLVPVVPAIPGPPSPPVLVAVPPVAIPNTASTPTGPANALTNSSQASAYPATPLTGTQSDATTASPLDSPPTIAGSGTQPVSTQTLGAPTVLAQILPLSTSSTQATTALSSSSAQSGDELTKPINDEAFDKLVDDLLGIGPAGKKLAKLGAPLAKPFSPPVPGKKSGIELGSGTGIPPSLRAMNLSASSDAVPKVTNSASDFVSFNPAAAAPAAAGVAGVAAVAAVAASKKAGRGNFPMMPMGGGAMSGGDDSNEPKRRSRKRAVIPPPIVQ